MSYNLYYVSELFVRSDHNDQDESMPETTPQQDAAPIEETLTTEDVADRLGLSEATIRRYAREQILPSKRVSIGLKKVYRFSEDAVNKFRESLEM